ncbi:GH3 auxin-responsive promoter [Macleaya cordata]|uniref:GH3 auxin-responsive promoter n=1 Tax=Macleaya cordata TaxID=56857 RepID=A0A200QVI6_MACCD|nr:GH3 auxin-responsive promoter [Macleaya cordata]
MSTKAPKNRTSATDDQINDYNVAIHENSTSNGGIINIDDKHKKALQFIEDVTTNADEIQKQVLYEILFAHVEYLQRHGLDGHTDRETFKKVIPVVTYEDLKPDITRIANGDTSPILCAHPISQLFTSSGTTGGEFKLMPTINNTKEQSERRQLFFGLVTPIISQYFPGQEKGKGMFFMFVKEETKRRGGLVQRSAVTGLLKSSQFKERPHDYLGNLTSLYETLLCGDSYQSMYSQLLCGLYQNNLVLRVGAFYAYGFILVISFVQQHWTLLCNDIRTGTLDARITDPSMREAILMKVLTKPNPELAEFIEAECSKDSWQGIITRLWPNTKYIDAVISGTMSQYVPALDYFSNGLPILSIRYLASEGSFGLNLNPLCKPNEVSYTLIPTMAYFEFLPIERNNDGRAIIITANSLNEEEKLRQQRLVDLVDVELGKEYELVVTTYAGFYRYRVGDVLRVAGFKNKAPQFKFVGRENVALSIDVEKTNEVELQNAVTNAVVNHLIPLGVSLEDYTTYADTSTIPGHYVVYWELRGPYYVNHATASSSSFIPQSVFEECCLTIEESLNSAYRLLRVSEKSIGPLEIKIVETGSFDKLMENAISRGASISQYKTPRCVKFAPIVELLNSRVLSNYFSSKCPKWVPGGTY